MSQAHRWALLLPPGHGHTSQAANRYSDSHLAEGVHPGPQECERVMKAFLHLPQAMTGNKGCQDSVSSVWKMPDTSLMNIQLEALMNFRRDSILPLTTTDHRPGQDSQGNNNDKGSNDNIQHAPLCQEKQNGEGCEDRGQEGGLGCPGLSRWLGSADKAAPQQPSTGETSQL